ncbi:Crp/Fnr family transcriptional regulator [Flammeovirga sp. EKP202]|uniref:Crp/Fnr family transcriptional regulator n=1 Tax=Flammeovirga sp. EKP202 TaxID=2770592 RepID=UPI00165EC1DC|nr:Crp/Fnr family transcriptional regulator [Flammeovirga sp. EKP202]MBD0402212.1 Crp/Fnr family transcriptional regulator [Flammeovirga sp. EKP202]
MDSLFHALVNSNENISELQKLSRGDLLIRVGEIEKHMYIVLDGAVRVTYFEDDNEEVHTIRFGYKNSILASIPSFFDGSPSLFTIECIRSSVIKKIHKKQFFEIINSNNDYQKEYDLYLQNFFKQQIEREIDLLTTSPTKRFERVIERSPQLFQHIPMKYIASYLRMQPETLSRIMKKERDLMKEAK